MKECKCTMKIIENAKSVDIVDSYRTMVSKCACDVSE